MEKQDPETVVATNVWRIRAGRSGVGRSGADDGPQFGQGCGWCWRWVRDGHPVAYAIGCARERGSDEELLEGCGEMGPDAYGTRARVPNPLPDKSEGQVNVRPANGRGRRRIGIARRPFTCGGDFEGVVVEEERGRVRAPALALHLFLEEGEGSRGDGGTPRSAHDTSPRRIGRRQMGED